MKDVLFIHDQFAFYIIQEFYVDDVLCKLKCFTFFFPFLILIDISEDASPQSIREFLSKFELTSRRLGDKITKIWYEANRVILRFYQQKYLLT